ncbi:MAG: alpha/beta fold hydrolase [Alphaproteobacteria bacterium]|nr:alpha/beta fold hydrolase [Alphaproteobacteria bacterium]
MLIRALLTVGLAFAIAQAAAQTALPNQREGDHIIKDFRFASGETLPELKMHYMTFGTQKKNAAGEITNAILLLHGTSGSSESWMVPTLMELYGKGQPLDASEYFIIVPDAIGRAGSSKPSDGLKAKFPHYRYRDIVEAEHRVVTEGIGIKHLRLVMGASMGGMQVWMWGEMYPDLMDGLVPIASQPVQISGRNWINRRIRIEAIRNDPGYNNGNYTKNPTHWAITAPSGPLGTENVVRLQEEAPTREAGDAMYKKLMAAAAKNDANDTLWGIEAVMDYDPSKDLEKIKAKLLAINFADDEANPPELANVEPAVRRIGAHAKQIVIPQGPQTHGHYTYFRAAIWKSYLTAFLKELPAPK